MIFSDFYTVGINGIYIYIYLFIYLFIMKNEKKFGAEIWKGYCPNRIVRGGLYCNTKFVLQPRWLEGGWFKEGLYCKMGVVGLETVLQYSLWYCKKRQTWQGLYCRNCIAGGLAAGSLYRNTKIVL